MAKPVDLQIQPTIGPGALSAAIAAAEAAVTIGLANFEAAIASLQAVNPTEADQQALARLAGQSSALSRLAEIAGRQALDQGRDQGEGSDG